MMLLCILFAVWLLLALTSTIGTFIAFAWALIGISFVISTRSRGFRADALFVFSWPLHLIAHWMGME